MGIWYYKAIKFLISVISLFSFLHCNAGIDQPVKKLATLADDTSKISEYLKLAHNKDVIKKDSSIYYLQLAFELAKLRNLIERKVIILEEMGAFYANGKDFLLSKHYYLEAIKAGKNLADTKRLVYLYNGIGKTYYNLGNYDSAEISHEKARKIAIQNKDDLGESNSLIDLGNIYRSRSDYSKSLKAYNDGFKISLRRSDESMIAKFYTNIGLVYKSMGNYSLAMNNYLKALQIKERMHDSAALSSSYLNIGVVFFLMGDMENALSYYRKNLQINSKLGNKQKLGNVFDNIAAVFVKKDQIDSALYYHEIALKLRKETGEKKGIIISLMGIGEIEKQRGNYKKALLYFQDTEPILQEINSKELYSNYYLAMAELYFSLGDFRKVIMLGEKGNRLSEEIQLIENNEKYNKLLYQAYLKTGNTAKALKSLENYNRIRDSLHSVNMQQAIIKSKLEFDYEKKALSDSLKILEEKKANQLLIEMKDQRIKQEKQNTYILISGIVLSLIFLVFIYNRFKLSNKQNIIISEQQTISIKQKEELEFINTNINESMAAAVEIQKIIFPTEESLHSIFKEHFLLFRPLEKLSGDFIWLKSFGSQHILVLGDCAGHGIPASLLTLFANELLNRNVNEFTAEKPSLILKAINDEIYERFHMNAVAGNNLSEGMDLAICSINRLKKKMIFIGSRINLDILTLEVNTIKGAKIVLGRKPSHFYEEGTVFREYELEFKENETYYLYTDGIKDQLKYRSNLKRFGCSFLQQFLLKNEALNLNEQHRKLTHLLEEATQTEKQIDDILMFGFRF